VKGLSGRSRGFIVELRSAWKKCLVAETEVTGS